MIGDDGTPIGPWTDSSELPLPWPPQGWTPGPIDAANSLAASANEPPPPPAFVADAGAVPAPPPPDVAAPPAPAPPVPPAAAPPTGGQEPAPAPAPPAAGSSLPPPPLSTERLLFPFGPIGELAGVPGVVMPSPADMHYAETVKQLDENPFDATGDVRGDLDPKETQRYFNDLYTRDPLKAQELESSIRVRRDKMVADLQSEKLRADIEARRRNADNYRAAMESVRTRRAQIDADADRLAAEKVDPMAGISTGQSIAGIVGAMIGGLYQARHGGENAGLKAWMAMIDRNIERQRMDLTNRREALSRKDNILAREVAEHGDVFRATEAMREAAVKQMDAELARRQLDFAPRGTTFMSIAKDRAQLAASQAEHRQKTEQKAWEDGLKLNDAYRQERVIAETERQNRAQNYLRALEIQESAATRRDARALARSDKEAERADKESERDRQFAIGGIGHVQIGPDRKPVTGPNGRPVVIYDDLRNADGKIWRAPSPTVHEKLLEKKTSTEIITGMYDRILALRARVGGESRAFNSDERQEMEGIRAELTLLTKRGTQGMSSDKDMDMLQEAAGANDVSSFRDKTATFKTARSRRVTELNAAFRNARYTGPELVYPEPEPAKNTPAEDATQRLMQKPTETADDIIKRELGSIAAKRGYPIDPTMNEDDRRTYWDVVTKSREDHDPGASTEQRAQIKQLTAAAAGGSVDAKKTLERVAASAHTARLRELAAEAVRSLAPRGPTPAGPRSEAVAIPDELKLPGLP